MRTLFCKHKWVVLSENTCESIVEKSRRLGFTIKKGNTSLFTNTNILVVTCTECGKLKRFVTEV